ncbi:MAG TPA: hypothetical protein VEY91_08415, partial [Candidatus Limnocylindria bacterium]|nr:hypothetical protein [Candidatus Limnocylindria bacterium]
MSRLIRVQSALLFLAAWLSPAPAHATKYAAEFLKIQPGARAIGMGGAFAAVADDATAPFWNPAGMVYLPYREVIPMHSEKFGSLINHDFIGGVWPLGGANGKRAAVGLALTRVAVDDIIITPRPGDLVVGRDYSDFGPDNDPRTGPPEDPFQGNRQWDPGERLDPDLTL